MHFYHNVKTRESTWETPEEYQLYLDAYNAYLSRSQQNRTSPQSKSEKINSKDKLIMPEGNSRKRRRITRAFMRSQTENPAKFTNLGATPVEFLSEYIAYSRSNSTESSRASSPDNSHPSQCDTKLDNPEAPQELVPESEIAFIGPQLPKDFGVHQPGGIEEQPSKNNAGQANFHDLSLLLLAKLSALDPQLANLTSLQVAYIQFKVICCHLHLRYI